MESLSLNRQWNSFLRSCAENAKEGLIDKMECGVDVYCTQCNWRSLNGLFLSCGISDEIDLRNRLEEMKRYAKKMQLKFPWFLSIECELIPVEMRERLEEICLSAEFVRTVKVKCMHTRELLSRVRSLPNVQIKFASSPEGVYDAVFLNLQAYNRDTSIAKSVIEHHALITNFDKEFCCIVLVNEKVVSTAVTVLLHKYIYVPLVATCSRPSKGRFYAKLILFCYM